MNATAADCTHSNRTPGGVPAGGSADAGAVDHVITGTACFTDLRDHAVLMERRERCGLRRCGKGQAKAIAINRTIVSSYVIQREIS
jgi:hypothetical protein